MQVQYTRTTNTGNYPATCAECDQSTLVKVLSSKEYDVNQARISGEMCGLMHDCEVGPSLPFKLLWFPIHPNLFASIALSFRSSSSLPHEIELCSTRKSFLNSCSKFDFPLVWVETFLSQRYLSPWFCNQPITSCQAQEPGCTTVLKTRRIGISSRLSRSQVLQSFFT